MNVMPIAKLDRKLLKISGDGATDWLSGLITNDLSEDINFAALLTPQGKIIADFFVVKTSDGWWVDTATKFADNLKKRLSMYRLRAPIEITETALGVYAAWEGIGEEGFEDPRLPALGRRIYTDYLEPSATDEDYDSRRLTLGIPDSHWDFETVDVFPATVNMDFLNGVNFKKGCFVGQEVVSRMYRKTDVSKRFRGVIFDDQSVPSEIETAIKAGTRVVGELRHRRGAKGMALIRHDRLPDDGTTLTVGATEIKLLDATHT